jgi:hypothetical protein
MGVRGGGGGEWEGFDTVIETRVSRGSRSKQGSGQFVIVLVVLGQQRPTGCLGRELTKGLQSRTVSSGSVSSRGRPQQQHQHHNGASG